MEDRNDVAEILDMRIIGWMLSDDVTSSLFDSRVKSSNKPNILLQKQQQLNAETSNNDHNNTNISNNNNDYRNINPNNNSGNIGSINNDRNINNRNTNTSINNKINTSNVDNNRNNSLNNRNISSVNNNNNFKCQLLPEKRKLVVLQVPPNKKQTLARLTKRPESIPKQTATKPLSLSPTVDYTDCRIIDENYNNILPDIDDDFTPKILQKLKLKKDHNNILPNLDDYHAHKSPQTSEVSNDGNNILPDLDDNFTQKPSQKSKYSSQITKKSNHTHNSSSQGLEVSDEIYNNIFSDLDNNSINKDSQKSKSLVETTQKSSNHTHKPSTQRLDVLDVDNNIFPDLDSLIHKSLQKLEFSDEITKKSNHIHKSSSQRLDVSDDGNSILSGLDNSFIYKSSQKSKVLGEITRTSNLTNKPPSQRLEALDYGNNILSGLDYNFIHKSSHKSRVLGPITKNSNLIHKPSLQRLEASDENDNNIIPDLNSFIYKFSQKCQITKNSNHTHRSSQRLEVPDENFNHIFPDLGNNLIHKYAQKSKYSGQVTQKSNLTHKPSSRRLEVLDYGDNILPCFDDNLIHKSSQKSGSLGEINKKNNLTHKSSSQILEISDDDNNPFPDLDDNLIHKYSQKSKALDEATIIDVLWGGSLYKKDPGVEVLFLGEIEINAWPTFTVDLELIRMLGLLDDLTLESYDTLDSVFDVFKNSNDDQKGCSMAIITEYHSRRIDDEIMSLKSKENALFVTLNDSRLYFLPNSEEVTSSLNIQPFFECNFIILRVNLHEIERLKRLKEKKILFDFNKHENLFSKSYFHLMMTLSEQMYVVNDIAFYMRSIGAKEASIYDKNLNLILIDKPMLNNLFKLDNIIDLKNRKSLRFFLLHFINGSSNNVIPKEILISGGIIMATLRALINFDSLISHLKNFIKKHGNWMIKVDINIELIVTERISLLNYNNEGLLAESKMQSLYHEKYRHFIVIDDIKEKEYVDIPGVECLTIDEFNHKYI
ncbi:6175_t:CDS:10 [Entrophospora sp. SA101]|nr:6175_t:CDS:10 [Entrophospora sp. SA101]